MVIFSELWKVDLGPFGNKLFIYTAFLKLVLCISLAILHQLSFQAFAIFCGIGIHNTHMYEQVCRSVAKQRVALEVSIKFCVDGGMFGPSLLSRLSF